MEHYIYALIDPRTNKIRYIGKTNNLKKRYSAHINDISFTYKSNWIKKLKSLDLKPILKIIGEYTVDTINIWEIFWINYYRQIGCDLTNMTDGGDGINNHSEEIRKKISESKKGKKLSKETCEKISKSNIGHPNYCKPKTQESKDKCSNTMKQKFQNGYVSKLKGRNGINNPSSKKVLQIDLKTNEIITEFPSIVEAQKLLNIHHISDVCNGKRNQTGGFYWEFKNKE